jgi:hypothetical protein
LFDIENPEKFRFSCRPFGEVDGEFDKAVIEKQFSSLYERCFSYLKIREVEEVYRQFRPVECNGVVDDTVGEVGGGRVVEVACYEAG